MGKKTGRSIGFARFRCRGVDIFEQSNNNVLL